MKQLWPLALVVLLVLAACGETPTGMSAIDPLAPQNASLSEASSDSVYWVDDVLEVTDSAGVTWRWERYGSGGVYTHADLYKNGIFVGQAELTYAVNGDVVVDTLVDVTVGGWAALEADWTIENTSEGTAGGTKDEPIKQESVGSGGKDGSEGRSDYSPGHAGLGTASGLSQDTGADCDEGDDIVMMSSCGGEYDAMQDAAWDAVAVGSLGAALTVASGGALYGPSMGALTMATGRALARLGDWIGCKIRAE